MIDLDSPRYYDHNVLATNDLNELSELIDWLHYLEVKNEEKLNGLLLENYIKTVQ